jgi:glycosyltransferase involved in cell wall biosynthesis
MKVIIYAAVDVFYYSFYIEGFYEMFGRKNVKFHCSAFPVFPERTFAAIVKSENGEKRIIIDAFDSNRIDPDMAAWSDVYGKVNYRKEQVSAELNSKIVPIGPSFAIKIWNFPELIYHLFFNYQKVRKQIFMKENFFKNYWRQFKRLPLKEYKPRNEVQVNYIYFISSLWKKENRVNESRAEFINACKNVNGLIFEGGFAPRSDDKTLGYDNLISPRIKVSEYLKKIKKSVLVFNTPAVQNCHGWKLAEYLALGKAIVSTEMFNEFPEEMKADKHLYILSKNEYIEEVILRINQDPDFRLSLEENGRIYYEKNLKPERVINRLIEH